MQHKFKFVTFVFLLGTCILLMQGIRDAQAGIARGLRGTRANPGKCLISPKVILRPGQTAKDPYACGVVLCVNALGFTNFTTCAPTLPPQNCRFGDSLRPNEPYPGCCEKQLICRQLH